MNQTIADAAEVPHAPVTSPLRHSKTSPWFNGLAGVVLVAGIIYAGYHLAEDLSVVRETRVFPFILLGIALLIALGFEFVNGFHDTANAVATVIYTHSLPAEFAVVWSGFFNLLGVLVSSGAVAFGIVSLLPVELILQVGSGAGFAMVFALLIAAIIWNLGTWYFGLPASSSHTLIGSIIGVGITNALMRGRRRHSGVDWSQATEDRQGAAVLAAVRLRAGRAAAAVLNSSSARSGAVMPSRRATSRRRWWIRGILILTCTGVSFATAPTTARRAWA
jgi:inorganic phosphate transporter, PiT family